MRLAAFLGNCSASERFTPKINHIISCSRKMNFALSSVAECFLTIDLCTQAKIMEKKFVSEIASEWTDRIHVQFLFALNLCRYYRCPSSARSISSNIKKNTRYSIGIEFALCPVKVENSLAKLMTKNMKINK